jgi:hypothetical protein
MEMKRLWLICLVFFYALGVAGTSYAQKKTKNQPDDVDLKSATLTDRTKPLVHFPNLNRVNYYQSAAGLQSIEKFEKADDLVNMHAALYDYVANFGIENFYKDTYLLWRLGKVAEALGYTAQAKGCYQYVLKHHRSRDPEKLMRFYDSLTTNERDRYLPLEHYYEMIQARKAIDTLFVPVGIQNAIGKEVNSPYSDYGPTITRRSDGRVILIFTSQRKGSVMDVASNNRQNMRRRMDEDLYISSKADTAYIVKTDEGSVIDTVKWTRAEPLTALNSDYNEGSACLSKDGKTIYFSRCEAPDGFGNCDLYMAELNDKGQWVNVRNLGSNVNSMTWDSHPSLSHSEDTLYFASDRLGGFGMSDIYYTFKQRAVDGSWDGKSWARARNMGPVINTRQSEISPFYHPKHHVLYFSSNGQLFGFGNFDIYLSRRATLITPKDTIHYWNEPRNTGPLINQATNEYYFTIDDRSEYLYFAKLDTFYVEELKDTVNSMNLYTFPLPMEAQPLADVTIAGVVTDSITGEAFTGIVSIIDLDNGIEVAPKYLRPDGSYQFDLIKNNNYLIIITGEDFFRVEREFLLKGDTVINVSTPSMKFKKWEFSTVKFEGGKWDVTPEMKRDLDKLVTFLVDHPRLGLKISGHTDGTGDPNANLALSQKRAQAIRDYIVERGKLRPDRIEAEGYGSSRPIVQENNEDDRRINRRVEFEIKLI